MRNQKILVPLLLASAMCAGPAVAREQSVGLAANQNLKAQTTSELKAREFAQEEEDVIIRQNQENLLLDEEAAQLAKQRQQQVSMTAPSQQTDGTVIVIIEQD